MLLEKSLLGTPVGAITQLIANANTLNLHFSILISRPDYIGQLFGQLRRTLIFLVL